MRSPNRRPRPHRRRRGTRRRPSSPDVTSPSGAPPRTCARCGTQLAAGALACPAGKALVHADRLKLLAAKAEKHTADGRLADARDAWEEALQLLPADTQQHAAIVEKAQALAKRIADDVGSADESKAAAR